MAIQYVGFFVILLLITYTLASISRKLTEVRAIDRVALSEVSYLKRLTEEAEARTRDHRSRINTAWKGWRKFRVQSTQYETEFVKSFYLVPHDKRPLPPFLPGQHIAIQINHPEHGKPLVRCYSLSCAPNKDYYRISVKREGAPGNPQNQPPGIVSNFLHESIEEGDFIDVRSPSGNFNLDLSRHTPIVLIGGGIGITPVYSMLDAVASQGSKREVWFFLGVRNRHEHAMLEKLTSFADHHDNFRLVVCYSDPTENCRKDVDFHHHGFVSVDLLRSYLAVGNYDFYFCGPPGMMDSLHTGFGQWGVPEARLHYEAFGPATIGKMKTATIADQSSTFSITFSRSQKTASWSKDSGSILELAEANGISIDSGCRAGNCGTCVTAVRSGKIDYLNPPGEAPQEGTCLVCAAIPTSDLELDA